MKLLKLNSGFLILIVFIISSTCFTSCAVDSQSENYNFEPISPLSLTSINHPHGYSKSYCFNCHLSQNIHEVNRLNEPSFPFAKDIVEQKGLSSCVGCHGANGVPQ